jgi:DNA-binding SARP family transcriptional activator/tetratricopeptide (TPR) repeat protein
MAEFRLLGEIDARVDGHGYDLGPARQRCVLAVLLVDANQMVSLGQLMERVWATRRPQRGRETLYTYLSRLRHRLSAIDGVAVTRCSAGYRLRVDPQAVDLHRFQGLVARAHAAEDDTLALRLLREALGLWRGEAFGELDTPWFNAQRKMLADQRLAAELRRGDIELSQGAHAGLVAELTGRAAAYPLDERVAGQLMLALYRCGRQADALTHYLRLRNRLAETMGVDPAPDLQRLHRRMLQRDPALAAPPPPDPAAVAGPTTVADPAATAEPAANLGPAPAADTAPCQLPPALADFTGRRAAVARLVAATQDPSDGLRIVAICGPAGVGKSSLALHLAHRLRPSFPDGQLHIDLRGSWPDPVDPATALGRLLPVLGAPPSALAGGVEERADRFRSLVTHRRMLFVLDDARSAAQVRPLLPGAATCLVIVTGRHRLAGLDGATHLVLDTFAPAEARSLLERIVGAARTAAEPAAATEIVHQCGHLPLAVRIAGARLAVRPQLRLEALAARLRGELARLDELTTEDLQVRASLQLSYQLLPEPARRLLRRLSLLDQPDVPAWVGAALLDAPQRRAEELLEQLVDACLLDVVAGGQRTGPGGGSGVDAPVRYRMHDLVRLFGRERAAAEEPEPDRHAALQRAFGGWLSLAEAADAGLPTRAAAPLRGAAPRWCAPELTVVDPLSWFTAERSALLVAVRQAAALGHTALAWHLAAAALGFFDLHGLHDEARASHQAALSACRRFGDQFGEAVMLRNLAALWTSRHDTQVRDKSEAAGSALRIFTALGESRGVVDALWLCADADRLRGRHTEAAGLLRRALSLSHEAGYALGECHAVAQLAIIGWEQGRLPDTRRLAERYLALARRIGARRDESVALTLLGLARRDRGQAALDQALAIARQIGDHVQETYTLARVGQLHARRGYRAPGERDRARTALGLALDRSRSDGLVFGEALARWGLGELALAEDRPESAVTALHRAGQLLDRSRWTHVRAQVLTVLGRAHAAGGEAAAAEAAWSRAHHIFRRIGNDPAARHVVRLLARRPPGGGPAAASATPRGRA